MALHVGHSGTMLHLDTQWYLDDLKKLERKSSEVWSSRKLDSDPSSRTHLIPILDIIQLRNKEFIH